MLSTGNCTTSLLSVILTYSNQVFKAHQRPFCIVFLLYFVKKYVKLKMPPQRVALRCYLQAQVVMLPSGKRPGDVKAYCLFPRSQTRKGGCIMVLNDVLQLFVIVGGTVGITFQIAWAIFKEIHNNKK